MPYGDINLVNIGSGNGLLPDGTKPLPAEKYIIWQKFYWPRPSGQYQSDSVKLAGPQSPTNKKVGGPAKK